jgi:hypothetical protein
MLAPKLREEATALQNWAETNIDAEKQLPRVASIENALRELYNELRPTGCLARAQNIIPLARF